jgi:sporulation protein YlmC with PRC-barrel domain
MADSLVSSSDVNGTDVYGVDGNKIGTIDHLMIDKMSGNVAYAVMSFGGFLGMGSDTHPVPWKTLSYDTSKNGFMTNLTEDKLKGAPQASSDWRSDREWETRSHQHYGVDPYWV